MILLLYFLILAGYIFSHGFFSTSGSLIIFLSIGLFPFFLNYKRKEVKEIFSVKSILIFSTLVSLLLYGGLYQNNIVFVALSYFLLSLNLILSLGLVLKDDQAIQARIFWLMFGVSFILRIFMIWSSPTPYIDVYDYLKNGALSFLSGKNPYEQVYSKLYANFTPDYYAYLPGMLFLTLPAVFLFQDPRYTFLFSEMAISLLILSLSSKNKDKYLFSLLFLNHPLSLYMIEQSYTEPLIVFLLLIFAVAVKNKKNLLTMMMVGLLLATKQYLVFLFPLFLKLMRGSFKRIRLAIGSILVALFLLTPFWLWNYQEFLKDAVFLQGILPPRYEGLSFFSLLFRFGGAYNNLVSGLIIAGFFLYIYLQKRVTLTKFFYLSSFLYLIFFYFNKWAFLNYYYLISQLLLISQVEDS